MPLNLYKDIYASGSVPTGWTPDRGGSLAYPVRNPKVLKYLRGLLPGEWRKIIKRGNIGEVHYFQHKSGSVADVKFFPKGAHP